MQKIPMVDIAPKRLTQDLLDTIAQRARSSPRLRQNYNLHQLSERVQRFVNVLQPGTYVRPHCHRRDSDTNGFEFFLVLQGELGMILFDDDGTILQREHLGTSQPLKAIELPEGAYHTLVALAPDTAILELKEGPYEPTTDKDFLEGFPLENAPEAAQMVADWQALFCYDSITR